jgi:catechol 2,3-dioxygenase-like lactoylglutathione lyase family enzyme
MEYVNIHHVGICVDDMDKMIDFLTKTLGLRLLTRHSRKPLGPGERAFVAAGNNQSFEILSIPDAQPRPDVPVYPLAHVIGIPHICLRVTGLPAWEEKLKSAGYPITKKFPQEGYAESVEGPLRVMWFTGPCGVGFELFEFKKETPNPQEP